ncbi:serine/threonine-protein phosphatase [Heliobacterium chlorum]|uniref:Serine/threonine-protein phosphatase n=1 Tax=Heliobacterium chlorum TaxID=2698 RepID=A0ABR7T444_HELCL|nr:protein phosphatase 2C domain-containing protein [Heliobacterium chlorum]MBC9784326.1 serine/threonine-protein phosphatase [Heliobacterium chlorum]
MRLTTAVISRIGGRESNQDRCDYFYNGQKGCWVVADGLGGHRGGERAAQVAVNTVLEYYKKDGTATAEDLEKCFQTAQKQVTIEQDEHSEYYRMKSTAVILLFAENIESGTMPSTPRNEESTEEENSEESSKEISRESSKEGSKELSKEITSEIVCGHIGDSRLYYFRDGKIVFITKDHSVSQAMADAGYISHEEIRFHEDRNRVLRSLGQKESIRPDIVRIPGPYRPGDAFLLCTDGFWEHVWEREMEIDLSKAETPDAWLELMEIRIMERAPEDHDNYSAISVFFCEF